MNPAPARYVGSLASSCVGSLTSSRVGGRCARLVHVFGRSVRCGRLVHVLSCRVGWLVHVLCGCCVSAVHLTNWIA